MRGLLELLLEGRFPNDGSEMGINFRSDVILVESANEMRLEFRERKTTYMWNCQMNSIIPR
jgi:hypothetical protein